ncbi:MAG: hypothetical protein ACYCW6_11580 [Candidatus Xenobia bacterium]
MGNYVDRATVQKLLVSQMQVSRLERRALEKMRQVLAQPAA